MKIFENSKRPLLIYGWGIHTAHQEKEALAFARACSIPVVCTWGAVDLFHHDDPLYFGGFGTHGVRYANFAVQNADVILTIGTRLDTKATGSPASDFAPRARIFMLDIDDAEIGKFERLGRSMEGIWRDIGEFFKEHIALAHPNCDAWIAQLAEWKRRYPPGLELDKGLNPYRFMDALSDALAPEDVIVSDTGCALGWICQAFKFKGQRLIHAFNNTPMGYGLPAAVGAAFAHDGRVILITGDGGLAVNITEFATVARHQLDIKTILFNNRGHAMCRQTQRTWLGGVYPSTSYEGGLACPDYSAIARAYDIPTTSSFDVLLNIKGPAFMELSIHEDYQLWPQVKFGRALDDAEPLLPRAELEAIRA